MMGIYSLTVCVLCLLLLSGHPVLTESPRVNITVPPYIEENSTTPIACNVWLDAPRRLEVQVHTSRETIGGIEASDTDVNAGIHVFNISNHRPWSRDDNGRIIRCSVKSYIGAGSQPEYTLSSHIELLNITFPPKYIQIDEIQTNSSETEVNDLILACSVGESNPAPDLRYSGLTSTMQTASQMHYRFDNKTNSVAATKILNMNVTSQDIGLTIECQASNRMWSGSQLIATHKINVTLAPTVSITTDSLHTVYTGHHVSVRCVVEGNPIPYVAWFNNYTLVVENERDGYLDLYLSNITLDQNGTVYTCTGENIVGDGKNKTFTLIVQDVPDNLDEETNLSFHGIGPIPGAGIMAANITVVIIVLVIYVRCRRKDQKKRRRQNGDQEEINECSGEVNTSPEDVVVYATVNKPRPPMVPIQVSGSEGTSGEDVRRQVQAEESISAQGVPGEHVADERSPHPRTPSPSDNSASEVISGATLPAMVSNDDTPVNDRLTFDDEDEEDTRRHYENVDDNQLDSLTHRNMLPPPYVYGEEENDPIDCEQDRLSSKPNTLVYADVEFPGCPRQTGRIIGDNRTIYSSVVFNNTYIPDTCSDSKSEESSDSDSVLI